MDIQLIQKPFHLVLYGYAGTAVNQNYGDTGFRLMNKMWEVVKSRGLKNKGINVWVYESQERVFAGVELEELPGPGIDLERKEINLSKYAYFKHIGPYSMLRQVNVAMHNQLESQGLNIMSPCLEIYGHHNPDESKCETELLMAIR